MMLITCMTLIQQSRVVKSYLLLPNDVDEVTDETMTLDMTLLRLATLVPMKEWTRALEASKVADSIFKAFHNTSCHSWLLLVVSEVNHV